MVFSSAIRADRHSACSLFHSIVTSEAAEVVGDDVVDQSGQTHLGIIAFPVPILKRSRKGIRELLEKLRQPEFQGVVAVDFSELAQGCKTYCDYITKMGNTPETDLSYLGLAICGSKRLVNQLTAVWAAIFCACGALRRPPVASSPPTAMPPNLGGIVGFAGGYPNSFRRIP